jgi:hypothetical protein
MRAPGDDPLANLLKHWDPFSLYHAWRCTVISSGPTSNLAQLHANDHGRATEPAVSKASMQTARIWSPTLAVHETRAHHQSVIISHRCQVPILHMHCESGCNGVLTPLDRSRPHHPICSVSRTDQLLSQSARAMTDAAPCFIQISRLAIRESGFAQHRTR